MIFNVYFKIENNLVPIGEIESKHQQAKNVDWYYYPGAIELVNESGDILLSKECEVDIIPVFREFFLMVASYSITCYKEKDFEIREKMCTKTSLYYGNIPQVLFSHMNDIYLQISVYEPVPEQQKIYKHNSLTSPITDFYKAFLRTSQMFADKVSIMFPHEEIETCSLIKNLMPKIRVAGLADLS